MLLLAYISESKTEPFKIFLSPLSVTSEHLMKFNTYTISGSNNTIFPNHRLVVGITFSL